VNRGNREGIRVFDGFTLARVDVGGVVLRVRHGGAGPAVLLLHGHPRTHATWHRVAPLLARTHTVVCPDLRGYGQSSKPPTTPDHAPYAKRAMAADCLALMAAAAWWHWFFYGQTAKRAEQVISADPGAWYAAGPEPMGAEAYADYRRAIGDPATVLAMMEDYRAGLGIDRRHDDEDRRAGRRVACPTLVLWATGDDLADLYGDVLAVWRPWAADLRGRPFPSGHHMAEESPAALAAELLAFLG
jgi:haloacetate dehalogenase